MQIATILESTKAIMKDFPAVAKALELSGPAVCKKLESVGAIKVVTLKGDVKVSDGTELDSVKAWRLFSEAVGNLTKANLAPLKELSALAEPISAHLVSEYYQRYPHWPSPDSSQAARIQVFTSFQAADKHNVIYALTTGAVDVCDRRQGQRYTASLEGELKLESLTVVKAVMAALNQAVLTAGVEKFVAICDKEYADAQLTDSLGQLLKLLG